MPAASISFTTSMPLVTLPKTTCFPVEKEEEEEEEEENDDDDNDDDNDDDC